MDRTSSTVTPGRRAPVFMIGHGSPMNALADNAYTRKLADIGRSLGRPRAVLCVSAHWVTRGLKISAMENPPTIHDFGGFPPALHAVKYPAPGDPTLARQLIEIAAQAEEPVALSEDSTEWGLDHGTWSILRHVFPAADIPVLQLSLDESTGAVGAYRAGRALRAARDLGVVIIGSGNVVHNLRRIQWQEEAPPEAWAVEFNDWVKDRLRAGDHRALREDFHATAAGRLSVPTPEHYDPLLVVLGAAFPEEVPRIEWDEIQNASISMLSFRIGE